MPVVLIRNGVHVGEFPSLEGMIFVASATPRARDFLTQHGLPVAHVCDITTGLLLLDAAIDAAFTIATEQQEVR